MIFRRIIYFVLLYAVITYNVLYRTYDGFIMLVFVVSASLLSFIMLMLSRLKLSYGFRQKTIYVTRAGEHEIRYDIKNVMPFPLTRVDMKYESQKKTQSFTVGATNTAIVTRKDRRQHCGCYFENIQRITLYDFFRVFGMKIKNPGVVKIVALPRLFDVNTEEYIEGMLCVENESSRIALKGSEVSGIREYAPGDSMKNIHHKLSSRMSKLMVKEYAAEEGSDDGFVFIDDDSAQPDVRDTMLEFMYNVMYLRLKTDKKATGYILKGTAAAPVEITSKEDIDNFFERVYEENEADEQGLNDIPSGAFVFAVSFTEKLYRSCLQLRGKADNIVLYLPDIEQSRMDKPDVEVVYISTGGEGDW